MLALGIETSCDETAAALVELPQGSTHQGSTRGKVVAASLLSQRDHQQWGGVVPEVAARNHLKFLPAIIEETFKKANEKASEKANEAKKANEKVASKAANKPTNKATQTPAKKPKRAYSLSQVDMVAAGCGPGLVGGVLVGSNIAKGIAIGMGIPFVAINHLRAHALAVRLEADCPFPYLTLLASGGHCLFAVVHSATSFTQIGSTIDDAAGEAFDKTARLLGLGFPGGAKLEKLATEGDPRRFELPRPLLGKSSVSKPQAVGGKAWGGKALVSKTGKFLGNKHQSVEGCDFSFSGLKTAVRRLVEKHPDGSAGFKADVAASFQQAMVDILTERANNALKYSMAVAKITNLVFCGGVAANKALRAALTQTAHQNGVGFLAPSADLCTDNAVMIGWNGLEMASQATTTKARTQAKAKVNTKATTNAHTKPHTNATASPLAIEATARLSIEA